MIRKRDLMMTISVVLTTYNAEKYLIKQLESIRTQTRKAEEVLIFDDRSSDNTVSIINEYVSNNDLQNWTIKVNEKNLGWKKNFKEGLLAAKGDIVFPCDQDDIWEKDKIELMERIFESDENILLLASSFRQIASDDSVKREHVATGSLNSVVFDEKFSYGQRPGCSMAIRNKLLTLIKDAWLDWYPHDAFLWTAAILYDGCYTIDEILLNYRVHENNTSSVMHHNSKYQIEALQRNVNLVQWYIKQDKHNRMYDDILINYLEFARLRMDLLKEKKVGNWIQLHHYIKYYRSLRQRYGDWIYISRIRR